MLPEFSQKVVRLIYREKKKYSSTLKCFHFKRLRLSAASLDTLIDKQSYELIWQSHNYSHKLSPVSLNLCS